MNGLNGGTMKGGRGWLKRVIKNNSKYGLSNSVNYSAIFGDMQNKGKEQI